MADVAFVGLGVMGYPMAGHLAAAGHRVTVYNRTAAKAEQWVGEHGGRSASTPAEAAAGAEFVFCCVGNDDDVRAVTMGTGGALEGMAAGSVLVDHTTASAQLARELAGACTDKDCGFVDAPVSGGQAGAENGALTVMCGGEPDVFERVNAVIGCYSRAVTLLGPAGSGQLTKAVNQLCIAGIVQGLSEGIHFAEKAGLDPLAVIGAISTGAAGSWQMDNRAETMVQGKFDYGFAVQWMRKDLGIALEEARRNGAHLPLAALVDQFYSEVTALGGLRWDTSSLVVRLRAMSEGEAGS
ncbi:MAG: NAD(P)-dependent oxidoreductase [Holophagales bacterium]|nr:NAD(P)-dependent oxidoreductase [Holophagales bacterium]MYG31292.1 NAD(P)-dependent oxidoreductase [Holophagales bacterium]MYI78886.1 NAD(P)-dependent oxidoreductase [Holophagales bacterium]